MSAYDDKRHIILGGTDILAHGHYSILDDEIMRAVIEIENKFEVGVGSMEGFKVYQEVHKRSCPSPPSE